MGWPGDCFPRSRCSWWSARSSAGPSWSGTGRRPRRLRSSCPRPHPRARAPTARAGRSRSSRTRPHPRVTADVVPTPPVPTDIYTVRADGSGLRRLTTDGAPKDLLAWSPDGSTLAYTVDPRGQVWTIAASGADRRLLCTRCVAISGGDQLAWSRNGDRLAARAPAGIVLIDPVTRHVALVRISPGVVGLSWSPDGRSLALSLSGEGLAILDVATGTHRIVDGARVAGPVAWLPDGRTIAFTTISYGPYQLHSGVCCLRRRDGPEPGPAGAPLDARRVRPVVVARQPGGGGALPARSTPSGRDCSRCRGTVRRSGRSPCAGIRRRATGRARRATSSRGRPMATTSSSRTSRSAAPDRRCSC